MNKVIPLAILLVMLFMLIISWNNVLSYQSNQNAVYDNHIKAAEEFAAKEIYIDAVNEYEAALKLRPTDYEIAMQIVDLYDKLGDESSYIKACQKAIDADKTKPDPYLLLADTYMGKLNYTKAYDILHKADSNIEDNQEIRSRIKAIKCEYHLLTMDYDTFSGWVYYGSEKTGYAKVSLEDQFGLLNTTNRLSLDCEYEDLGLLMNDLIPVSVNGEWYYITSKGYRKLVTDQPAEYLGCFSSTYAAAKIEGKYGYIDKKAAEYHFEYDYAGSFYNGIAAVKKGNKWGVIDTAFQQVVDFELDDILIDDYGFCSIYGVFWAKRGDQYFLYNTAGECISEGFEEVKPFASNEPAAAKKSGKWCFVSKAGEIVLETGYNDVDSFSLGYAPYLENGKWGCMDENGDVLIEPTFDAMQPFAQNGYALVEVDGIQKFAVVSIYD